MNDPKQQLPEPGRTPQETNKDERPSDEKGYSQLDKEIADTFPASDPPSMP